MQSALIVTGNDRATAFFTEMLNEALVSRITVLQTCSEARRMLMERDFDLVIVNAPLKDESGERFSRHIAAKSVCQVILVVKNEFYDSVTAVCEDDGVLTVSKPINKSVFWSVLKLAKASHSRMRRMQAENAKLEQMLEDIRIVNRAKCVLISQLKMTEDEAHKYIEKQAMDKRLTKRLAAENILMTING